ncbi:hypothetical protein AB6A40_005576 [Gnathostoma spinigerum]|uniref:Uncharacterized protein n=1 Tax=Gnathostoma spinigerum TaxID=75299 RepID=A0ABD6EI14_9BILA
MVSKFVISHWSINSMCLSEIEELPNDSVNSSKNSEFSKAWISHLSAYEPLLEIGCSVEKGVWLKHK